MDVFRLDLAAALTQMYRHMADAGGKDNGPWHPGHYPVAMQGLSDFYERLTEELAHPRERSPGLHLSDVTGDYGWECDRYLFFVELQEPKSVIYAADMIRVFEVGKGMHLQLFQRVVPALQMYYGERLEITRFGIEEPVPDDGTGISGTTDIQLEFLIYQPEEIGNRETAVPQKVVVDVKSTSVNESKKRRKKSNMPSAQEVNAEPKYQRQVACYSTRTDADYAMVLYWEKQFPHEFFQATRPRQGDRVYDTILKRVARVREHIERGTLPNPNRSACAGCPYFSLCQGLP